MPKTNPINRLSDRFPQALSNVDGLFEHFFGPTAARPFSTGWGVPATVWEEDDELHVELDAPGAAKEDVDVTFDKGELSITVARKRPEERRLLHNERGYGKVTRTVALPETVDADSLRASLADGVLHVAVGKRPEAKPKRVELE